MIDKNDYIKDIAVGSLFSEKYEVPIYQRNYAWGNKQIEQLMDDILDIKISEEGEQEYYIGTLVVNCRDDKYEVVDGQQRLTTLFLIMSYLEMDTNEVLRFEARERSNRLLQEIKESKDKKTLNLGGKHEISIGYSIIQKLFQNKRISDGSKIDEEIFKEKLKKVHIVRVEVPENIDLNHYFEIMNTRGEQLELHEIAKSKMLTELSDEEKVVASLIWEACAGMDSYLHMNLSTDQKATILSENRDELANGICGFADIVSRLALAKRGNDMFSLGVFWENPDMDSPYPVENEIDNEEHGNGRFESIIGFPQFLLHVNAAIKNTGENEESLDDKRLLEILKDQWKDADTAKNFLFQMIKYRLVFDKYVIKRDKKKYDEGKWSLLRSKKYSSVERNSVYYVGTFNDDMDVDDEVLEEDYSGIEIAKNILTLQSALRITYTSPKTMHWITMVLEKCGKHAADAKGLLELLENYAILKVKDSGYRDKKNWMDYQRIVFTYIDYILYRDGYSYKGKNFFDKQPKFFEFKFRTSIEHFYPQQPLNHKNCPDEILHSLGNLALITVSANSKVSNLDPVSKVNSYKDVISESLKLQVMAEMVGNDSDDWIGEGTSTISLAKEHEAEMYRILDNECEK